MKKTTFLFGLILLFISKLSAQQIDSMMSVYAENFPQEKIHIHFDKSSYSKGETIWFKAYVMADITTSDYSHNFYVDWFDEQGKLISHTASPMFESSARGQFIVPEKYTGKLLHAKAYTNWMLNFDTAFLYNKDLRVDQSIGSKAKHKSDKLVASIHYFPESGDLVGGVVQQVAFLATNQYGIPVNISGAIKNSQGELVDSFTTVHDGMGTFSLQVDAKETYTTSWVDEYGEDHITLLPITRQAGAMIQVRPLKHKIIFVINRSEEVAANFKTLYAIAHINQHEIYKFRINLISKTSSLAEIATDGLPTGIVQITLFDANWVPIAERAVFVNNEAYSFEPIITITKKGLAGRARNALDVFVPDSSISNMSMAITDADLLVDSSNTIISQMLLAADIKGAIHNPSYYFLNNSDTIRQQLDLVMLTHGWRRFNWAKIANNQPPVNINSRDTDYLQISGSVSGVNAAKSFKSKLLINLVLQASDSSKQFLFLPVSPSGHFIQKGVSFYDTLKIYYQFNGDKRLTNRAVVKFTNGLIPPPATIYMPRTAPLLLWKNPLDSIAIERERFFYAEKFRIDQFATTTLQEITLRAKLRSAKELLDDKYASGLFSGGEATNFDIENDPSALGMTDVFRYLTGRVAGLQISETNGETTLSWRGSRPEIFLDEMRIEADQLEGLSMSDVAYVKVFHPPFFGASGGGAGGAIAVYTRKGTDVKYTPGDNLGFQLLAGYTKYKDFFNPDYSTAQPTPKDVRTTLYWNPFILTDKKNNSFHIEFFNNDISKRLRIILEGMNSDGKLTRVEKIIE